MVDMQSGKEAGRNVLSDVDPPSPTIPASQCRRLLSPRSPFSVFFVSLSLSLSLLLLFLDSSRVLGPPPPGLMVVRLNKMRSCYSCITEG